MTWLWRSEGIAMKIASAMEVHWGLLYHDSSAEARAVANEVRTEPVTVGGWL